MLAFHNNPKIKEKYLERVKSHREADQLIKGTYWEDGKGCAVGCTIHSSNHTAYEDELGIPSVLARVEDKIFEMLPNKLAMLWPEKFLKAIKPGTDLSKVWNRFAYWILMDKENGVLQYAKHDKTKLNIELVAKLYLRSLDQNISANDWAAAYAAAYAAYAAADAPDAAAYAAAYAVADAADAADAAAYAAAYAAYAAAYAAADAAAYAAYAADAAAYAAAYAADAAAYAAYAADAADAAYATAYAAAYAAVGDATSARQKAIIIQSEKLLELLSEA